MKHERFLLVYPIITLLYKKIVLKYKKDNIYNINSLVLSSSCGIVKLYFFNL